MSRFRPLPRAFHQRDAETVARDLLGRFLVRRRDGTRLALKIVETEAYLGEGDRASHAWRGVPTNRTATLFRTGGRAYVYLIYGLHHLFNVVAGPRGEGLAVLVRAGEPVQGGEEMAANRGLAWPAREGAIAGGPGRLARALAIDRSHDGMLLGRGELAITRGEPVPASRVVVGPRIGVDYAGEAASWPLRFAVNGNRHVSRPYPW